MGYRELAEFVVTGKVREHREPVCDICNTILTEEEESHCGDLCFDCADKLGKEVEDDWKHPDSY